MGKFIQKIKIFNLIWNLAPNVIRICRIQWWCTNVFVLDGGWPLFFFRQIGPKNWNCQIKLKFGIKTNSNMHNSVVVFPFSVLHRKYRFLPNLVQKIKIVSLSWNLLPRLIRMCRLEWRGVVYFFCFRPEIRFLGEIWSKKLKLLV